MNKFLVSFILLLSSLNVFSDVDLKKSRFKWLGTKVTGKHFGEISLKSASLKMKEEKIQSGRFEIDLNSMTVTDLTGEWADKFLGHMKSSDFFDVKKFPTAVLEIKKVDDKNIYGKMTIKGKINEIKIPYKKSGKTYSGKMTFDRTKYDMVYGSGNFFKNLGDKVIYDEVTIDFSVVIK